MILTRRQLNELINRLLIRNQVSINEVGAGAPLLLAPFVTEAIMTAVVGYVASKAITTSRNKYVSIELVEKIMSDLGDELVIEDAIEKIETVRAFGENCDDQNLLAEIGSFVSAGEAILTITGDTMEQVSFDTSDTVSTTGESGIAIGILSPGVGQVARNFLLNALKFTAGLSVAWDVMTNESKIAAVRDINFRKLKNDIQGFENLYNQIKGGMLQCFSADAGVGDILAPPEDFLRGQGPQQSIDEAIEVHEVEEDIENMAPHETYGLGYLKGKEALADMTCDHPDWNLDYNEEEEEAMEEPTIAYLIQLMERKGVI